MSQAVAGGEFAIGPGQSAGADAGPFTLAQHACWREYRAAVVKELVDACESFDYSPRDILSALESHVDRASPSELDATPGAREVADLLTPYKTFENSRN